jgi:RimJ/RimL family protein N-acetyltransferase
VSYPERVETARLLGERPTAAHEAGHAALMADPRVAAWLLPPPAAPLTPVESRRLLGRLAEDWERDGFGLWMVRERSTGEMVGRVGLRRTDVEGAPEVEVGWAIAFDRWNRGYATELAREAIRLGEDELGLRGIVSFTMVENEASQAVMRKLGMLPEREFVRAGLPHVLYRR